jgi:hypothetical protein
VQALRRQRSFHWALAARSRLVELNSTSFTVQTWHVCRLLAWLPLAKRASQLLRPELFNERQQLAKHHAGGAPDTMGGQTNARHLCRYAI